MGSMMLSFIQERNDFGGSTAYLFSPYFAMLSATSLVRRPLLRSLLRMDAAPSTPPRLCNAAPSLCSFSSNSAVALLPLCPLLRLASALPFAAPFEVMPSLS
jgi:hypothetical protein